MGLGIMVGLLTLAPVLSTDRLPPSFFAVTSQAMREQVSPRIGLRVAAIIFSVFVLIMSVLRCEYENARTLRPQEG